MNQGQNANIGMQRLNRSLPMQCTDRELKQVLLSLRQCSRVDVGWREFRDDVVVKETMEKQSGHYMLSGCPR